MFKINKSFHLNNAIPDNSKKGLVFPVNVFKKGSIQDITVKVEIQHPFISDLTMQLTSPGGKKVLLHDRAGGDSRNMTKTFKGEVLQNLIGNPCEGTWKLQLKDHSPRDAGKLKSWSLDLACSEKKASSEIIIPDDSSKALESIQECHVTGRINKLKVKVDIEHPFIGDLVVDLVTPSGKSITLHNREGGAIENLVKTYSGEQVKAMIGEPTAGAWKLRMRDYAPKDSGSLKKWKVIFNYQQMDDLKKIEGIGPKIESLLNEAGIASFTRLSATSTSTLKKILEVAGERYKMHDPTTWPDQSKMAAAGQWEALAKWQDKLDGGRLN